jgi:ubiquitin-conjugating enzyme E2 D/E
MTSARVNRDLQALQTTPLEGISVETVGDDLFHLRATIQGPPNTPYDGGSFVLDLKIPLDYPLRCPSYTMVTKIYHPNVGQNGEICKRPWTPKDTLSIILQYLYSLLSAPDLETPLSNDIGTQYQKDRAAFDATAREWTRLYATGA